MNPNRHNVVYWLHDHSCILQMRDGYVGITCDVIRRAKDHRRSGRFPVGFDVSVLFQGTRAECEDAERRYRPQPNIGWNISSGGCGGQIPSPATRQKQSEARRGKKQSPELIAKRTACQKGRALSPEHRAKLSSVLLGKSKSAEHRRKLRDANLGKSPSKETLIKLSGRRKGRKFTETHRQNISRAISLWHQKRLSPITMTPIEVAP